MNLMIEKNVEMQTRDGVTLRADIYRPAVEETFPVILLRTPYDKELVPSAASQGLNVLRTAEAGYAVVVQDCRGRFASEGEFRAIVQEDLDGEDTVAWVAVQPWSNGRVGLFGQSYLGTTAWRAASQTPAAVYAMATPVTPASFYGDLAGQGGATQLGGTLFWNTIVSLNTRMRKGLDMLPLSQATADWQALYEQLPLKEQAHLKDVSPQFFTWLEHPEYDDFWRSISLTEAYEQITVPNLQHAGWFDIFLAGNLAHYKGMKERGGSSTARQHQRLVIGPWVHPMTADYPEREFGAAGSYASINPQGNHLRWFDYWLKGIDTGISQEKPVKLFVMGHDQWREEDDWPLPDMLLKPFYLHSDGKANTALGDGTLSLEQPTHEAEDIFLYDPRNPVPTLGGTNFLPWPFNSGPRDQRQIEMRADVLCYSTPVLQEELEVTGPLSLVLYVASSAPDTDFTAKLVDVYPDGRALILADGILRMRYRESKQKQKMMIPGQIYNIEIDLVATSNVFLPGHRIRLEVSSSNFPKFSRNSNTGGEIASESADSYREAVNRVYHSASYPSHLLLPIIDRRTRKA